MDEYKNRHGQSFSAELVRLARISPKAYADRIRERNLMLLERLDKATPEMLEAGAIDTGELITVFRGCPHCGHDRDGRFMCSTCLWMRCFPTVESTACVFAEYPAGTSLMRAHGVGINLQYSSDSAHISVTLSEARAAGVAVYANGYNRVRGFVEDHVDWANLNCWGEDCKEQHGD